MISEDLTALSLMVESIKKTKVPIPKQLIGAKEDVLVRTIILDNGS